jgi:hypothetical protein
MAQLTLKHANASRPSGQWSDDDYDIIADVGYEATREAAMAAF